MSPEEGPDFGLRSSDGAPTRPASNTPCSEVSLQAGEQAGEILLLFSPTLSRESDRSHPPGNQSVTAITTMTIYTE